MADEIPRVSGNRGQALYGVTNDANLEIRMLRVNPVTDALVVESSGSSSNSAASATGAAVPASADYQGVNVGGTLRGQTGVNPTGTVYAAQTDLTSVNGATVATGNGAAAGSIRVALPTDGTGVVGLNAGSAIVGKVGIDQTTPGTTNLVALAANQSVNVSQVAGATAQSGSGTATGALRVELPTNGTGVIATVSTVTAVTNVATIGTSVTPGTAAANLGKAEDAAHTTGDTGVFALGVSNEAQTSLNADGDYSIQATDVKGNRLVVGNLAADAVDAGFPVKVGGQARTTNPTAVADADRSNFITDKLGKQVVVGSIRDLKVNQVTTITSSTAETTILTAVASTFLDLYGLIVTNTSATAVNVAVKDDTAGTTQLNIAVPAGETRGFMLPESGAVKQGTVNKNWTATSSASVASLVITALAVKNT